MSSVLDLFTELCALPSPPGEERDVADRVTRELRARPRRLRGRAGAAIGSTIGNLLCRLPGRTEGGTPIFFCAHLDTVPPQGPLEPVLGEDGIVRNTGGTILGADNKSAVVAMIEAARRIVEEGRPHAGVELLFTPKEEVGLIGAGAFDIAALEAELGFVYDQAAPIGDVIMGAPTSAPCSCASTAGRRTRGWFPRKAAPRSRPPRGDRRPSPRPDRRGDDRERRPDRRRQCAQHRPGVVHARSGGALARRAQARRPRPGDARHVRVRREHGRRVHARDRGQRDLPGLPLQGPDPIVSSRGRRSSAAVTSSSRRSPAAAPTRTSSTRRACRA